MCLAGVFTSNNVNVEPFHALPKASAIGFTASCEAFVVRSNFSTSAHLPKRWQNLHSSAWEVQKFHLLSTTPSIARAKSLNS